MPTPGPQWDMINHPNHAIKCYILNQHGQAALGKSPNDWQDLIAFLAILATAMILIVIGRITAGGLTTACAALAGVSDDHGFPRWARAPAR